MRTICYNIQVNYFLILEGLGKELSSFLFFKFIPKMSSPRQFVHLHVHTHYSLLDGLTKIDELIKTAKADGAPAVAITDHGVMYGVIEFYQKCKKAGIKPIIGVETYLAPNSRFDKITREDEKKNYHLLLLAKNLEGYQNLIKLTSIAHLEGFYYKPRIDWEVLSKYHEGLIASSACMAGEIPYLIRTGAIDKARERVLQYNELFGQGNYYLELMHHPELEELGPINEQLIKFSKELNIPLIATNDVHYLNKEDDEAQDILLCLQNKKKKDDIDRMNMVGPNYSLRPAREMIEAFSDMPEVIENTIKIAEECNLDIELGHVHLPFFQVPEGFDGSSFLRKLCVGGLKKRYNKTYQEISKETKERLDFELSVIDKMGWPSYFLIVADFVNWAKNEGIVVGPGRGSAAGSLVCYLTGITNLDPLEYGLLFERFLNPDRISMPDIDLDFADARRDEVIRYVEKKYGKDHVAQIITFGTMAARAAVRDVGRVLNYPYDFCDKLAKSIPMFTKIDKALKTSEELRGMYETDEAAKKTIDYARRLEGVARHASTHACGVLITKRSLTEYVPLQNASNSDKKEKSIVSQYSLHPIEDLGLLKMDFLGLKNLTIIESAIRIIKNTRGIDIDIHNIPLADAKTYKLFQVGETTGVFQFESSGMKRWLKELKPTEFEDIIAMVALYRPGPMEWIPDYVAGKQGKKKPRYLHPKLEPILTKTYGVAIYQEQVMQMARDLAGFTMAEADVLRKAVGKKIPKLLAEQKEKFIYGCVKNSISTDLAEKIFSFIEPFAGYGFNRSHAACYALIGYQTAYLKANWPSEFMAALLTADQQNIDRVAIEIEESQRMGIEVKKPNINQSFESFTVIMPGSGDQAGKGDVEPNTIRFGLNAIKNIGEHIAEVLIKERKENGPYRDVTDILERITDKDLNKKSLESLIKSGALDDFGERGMLLANMDNMLAFNKQATKDQANGQANLFSSMAAEISLQKLRLENHPPAGRQDKLRWEKELLGLYVTEHPFQDYKDVLDGIVSPINSLQVSNGEETANIAGIITKVQKIITRNNKAMLFARIEDDHSGIEVLVFPNLLATTQSIWQEGSVVLCQGRISDKDQELKILANSAIKLTLENVQSVIRRLKQKGELSGVDKNIFRQQSRDLKISFINDLTPSNMEKLKGILGKHKGVSRVFIEIRVDGQPKTIVTDFRVKYTPILLTELKSTFGNLISVS